MVKFPATVKSQQEALKMYLTYSWTQITYKLADPTPQPSAVCYRVWMKISLSTHRVKKKLDLEACTLSRFESI